MRFETDAHGRPVPNTSAPCVGCGESVALTITAGDAVIDRALVTVYCQACAVAAEADQITFGASRKDVSS